MIIEKLFLSEKASVQMRSWTKFATILSILVSLVAQHNTVHGFSTDLLNSKSCSSQTIFFNAQHILSTTRDPQSCQLVMTKPKETLNSERVITGNAESNQTLRPIDLPKLTHAEENLLRAGQRIQRQTRSGKKGMGFACVDVKAEESTAWSLLLNYRRYPAFMSTIRDALVFKQLGKLTKAEFMISRFKFPVRTVLQFDEPNHTLKFDLDPDCKVPAGVFKFATGYWFIEPCPYCENRIRVWLKGDVQVSRAIPGFIVEYGAERALPRASSWIKPIMEAEQRKMQ